jgi:hypothetical protein
MRVCCCRKNMLNDVAKWSRSKSGVVLGWYVVERSRGSNREPLGIPPFNHVDGGAQPGRTLALLVICHFLRYAMGLGDTDRPVQHHRSGRTQERPQRLELDREFFDG